MKMFSYDKYRILFLSLIFTIITSVSSCGTFSSSDNESRPIGNKEIEKYWFKFYMVNSRVKVYLNENELYDSGVNTVITDPFKVGISDQLKPGKNLVRVDLLNGPPYDDSLGFDMRWEIDYEIFNYKDPIDFVYEKNDQSHNGLVWSKEYEIINE